MTGSAPQYLRVCNVHKVFGAAARATVALNGVDLAITKGSFVSVVGPSGCGKSTLLQIIAGLIDPTSGDILLEGRKTTGKLLLRVA